MEVFGADDLNLLNLGDFGVICLGGHTQGG